jgi:hypothetical protein
MLSGTLTMQQASVCDGLSFDPFPFEAWQVLASTPQLAALLLYMGSVLGGRTGYFFEVSGKSPVGIRETRKRAEFPRPHQGSGEGRQQTRERVVIGERFDGLAVTQRSRRDDTFGGGGPVTREPPASDHDLGILQ